MPGLVETVTGGLDQLAGSTDEAVGRVTSDNGDPGWGPDDTEALLDNAAGSTDEWVSRSPLDPVIDTVWSGHSGDTADVFGPTVFGTDGSVVDVIVSRQGESHAGETSTALLLVGVVALVVLWIVGPILAPLLEGAVGGDDEG